MTRRTSGRTALPWGATAFLLLVLSGVLNLVASSWSPFFRLNLLLHPLLGVIVAAGAIRMSTAQLCTRIRGLSRAMLVGLQALVFLAFFKAFVFRYYAIGESNAFSAGAFLVVAVLGAFLYARGRHLPLFSLRAPDVGSHGSRMLLWSIAAASGMSILLAGGGRPAAALADFHAVAALVTAVIGVLAFLAGSRARPARLGATIGLTAVFAAVVPFAVNAVGHLVQPGPPMSETTIHLSTIPLEQRPPSEQDPRPNPIGAEWVDISASCGSSSGCHEDLLDDLRHSVHGISYRTAHLQKTLGLLADEIGPQNQNICAGCHTPTMFFSGGGQAEDYRQRDNLSCVLCHSISRVALPDDSRKSSYTIDLPVDHLSMFVGAERAGGRLSAVNQLLIRLNPSAHGKVFRRDLYNEDRYCLTCHHLQLRGVTTGRTCVQCHMEPRDSLGLSGKAKNHFFPGAGTTIPLLAGFEDYAALNERWMQGFLLRGALEDVYTLDQPLRAMTDSQRLHDLYYLVMSAAFDPAPECGRTSRLRIQTGNTGIGHAFPSSSLDLEEVWLEVRVTDDTGRLLFSSGGIGAAQQVLPDSHRMGGYLIGLDNQTVTHYRIWQVREEVVERMILPGRTSVDDFEVPLPDDCGTFITVEATWRYRKLGHDYWMWAYGPATAIPSPVVARELRQFAVAPRMVTQARQTP